MVGRSKILSFVCALALGMSAAGARANPEDEAIASRGRRSSLSWVRTDGTESCIAATQLARSVEATLGREVFVSASDSEIAVEGRAERTPDGFRAVLVVTDSEGRSLGERTLTSRADTCDELSQLTVVTVALMIDPLTAEPEPLASEPEVPPSREADAIAPTPGAGWRIEVDASLAFAAGLLPTPTFGGALTVVGRPANFVPLVAEGALFPFSTVSYGGGREARLVTLYAGIAICPLWKRFSSLEVHGCAGVDAGALVVAGDGRDVDDRERLLGQARLSGRLHWDVNPRASLRAGLHLVAPFRHAAITADDGAIELFAPFPIAGILDFGVGVHFP